MAAEVSVVMIEMFAMMVIGHCPQVGAAPSVNEAVERYTRQALQVTETVNNFDH